MPFCRFPIEDESLDLTFFLGGDQDVVLGYLCIDTTFSQLLAFAENERINIILRDEGNSLNKTFKDCFNIERAKFFVGEIRRYPNASVDNKYDC